MLCDLGKDRWPFDDDSVDEVVASHVLEHLSSPEFMHALREIYRVCSNGAKVEVTLPHPRHDIFLSDPTHQLPLMPGTFLMFSKEQQTRLSAGGVHLTPFWKYLGVDFRFEPQVRYKFAEGVDSGAPDIAWQMKHLNNIVQEWSSVLTVVK